MPKPKIKTKKEIDAEIKKGEAFIKEHPFSMFGDDNVAKFKLFMKIIDMFREGKSFDEIERIIDDAYTDEDQIFAFSTVDWLRGDVDEIW